MDPVGNIAPLWILSIYKGYTLCINYFLLNKYTNNGKYLTLIAWNAPITLIKLSQYVVIVLAFKSKNFINGIYKVFKWLNKV